MSTNIIKIMLADDHDVVRSGLRRLLENKTGLEVVAEAASGEQAYQNYGTTSIDVVVMDLSMPGMGGLEAARRIITRYPTARILIFSMLENTAFISQALKVGVKGYVSKTGAASEIANAVLAIAKGNTYLSADIAHKIAQQSLAGEDDPLRQLSAREFEIFRLVAEGLSAEAIADMLKISHKTVSNYHTMIKRKLGVDTPIEMVRLAIRHGAITG
jgi:two-component system invasion response regulator UvrY